MFYFKNKQNMCLLWQKNDIHILLTDGSHCTNGHLNSFTSITVETGQSIGPDVYSAWSENVWAFISLEMFVSQLGKQEGPVLVKLWPKSWHLASVHGKVVDANEQSLENISCLMVSKLMKDVKKKKKKKKAERNPFWFEIRQPLYGRGKWKSGHSIWCQ